MIEVQHKDDGTYVLTIDPSSQPFTILFDGEPIQTECRFTREGWERRPVTSALALRVLESLPRQVADPRHPCQCQKIDDPQ